MKEIDKKSLIIKKSQELFLKFGISRVTVKEIAESAGVSKKTIYNYFKGKDELKREAVKEFLKEADKKIDEIKNDNSLNFFGKIKSWLKFVQRNLFKLKQEFLEDIQKKHTDLWKLIEIKRKRNINKLLKTILEQGQKEGIVKKDLNIELIITLFYRNIVILTDSDFVYKSGKSAKELINGFLDLFMNGILKKKKTVKID